MIEAHQWQRVLTDAPDHTDILVYADWLDEQGHSAEAEYTRHLGNGDNDMLRFPGEVGQCWFICTVTLYYVGRITEIGAGYLKLEKASWVHWTGRLSTLLKNKKFTNRARVEPCGVAVLSTASIVSAYPWSEELPERPIE